VTQAQFLADAGQRLINGVFIVSVLFPVVTTFFWAWWRSEWGWNIILLEACIAATLLPAVLLIDFGIDDITLRWIQAAALLLVGAVIIWRGVLIWRTQRAGSTRELESGRATSRAPAPPTPGMRGRFRVYWPGSPSISGHQPPGGAGACQPHDQRRGLYGPLL
jgi:hypothetical protein